VLSRSFLFEGLPSMHSSLRVTPQGSNAPIDRGALL
jgi:hypothetical protein